MLVRKCNVCGKIYNDPWREDVGETTGMLDIIHPRDNDEPNAVNPTRTDNLDLCPECLKRVLEFVDVLKETHETGETYCIHICPKEE